MRTALLASLLVLAATIASGCVALGCGGFDGTTNRVYRRDGEMLMLCDNGGFVVMLETTMLEGRYSETAPGVGTGLRGEDGQLAFELTDHGDGTASAPQLGDAMWTAATYDQVELDHANVLCEDLEYRTWW